MPATVVHTLPLELATAYHVPLVCMDRRSFVHMSQWTRALSCGSGRREDIEARRAPVEATSS